jgi:hypothetical protein
MGEKRRKASEVEVGGQGEKKGWRRLYEGGILLLKCVRRDGGGGAR